MKTITITDFQLSKPEERDYNWNSEFKQTFGKHSDLRLLSFELPEDMFYLSYTLCLLRSKGLTHFEEFNGTIEDKTKFKAVVLIEPEVKEFEFIYMSKNERIRDLLQENEQLELQIKKRQEEILSLS